MWAGSAVSGAQAVCVKGSVVRQCWEAATGEQQPRAPAGRRGRLPARQARPQRSVPWQAECGPPRPPAIDGTEGFCQQEASAGALCRILPQCSCVKRNTNSVSMGHVVAAYGMPFFHDPELRRLRLQEKCSMTVYNAP